jgi:hypothetical protein
MEWAIRCTLAALVLAPLGCSQNSAPAASSAAPQDWVARAVAAMRVSNEPEDTRNCDFVAVLSIPGGWDGHLKDMTAAEQEALDEMKVEAATRGGNFVLLTLGQEPLGEAYLCTE